MLNPNLNNYFWKLTQKNSIDIFSFFIGILTSKQVVPTSLFSFQLMASIRKICWSFYVIFLCNVSSNNVWIWLGKTQNTENQKPWFQHWKKGLLWATTIVDRTWLIPSMLWLGRNWRLYLSSSVLLSMDIIVSKNNLLTETMENKTPKGLNLNATVKITIEFITSRKISDSICLLGTLE